MGTRGSKGSGPDADDVMQLARRLRARDPHRGGADDDPIDGHYIQRAAALARGRAQEHARRAQAEADWKAERRRRARTITGAVVLFGALVGLGTSGVALYGASALTDAQSTALRHEAELERALTALGAVAAELDRSAPDAPLAPLRAQLDAEAMADRIQAAEALAVVLLQQVQANPGASGGLRTVTDAADGAQRAALDWEQSQLTWEQTASGSAGRLAITLGLATPPADRQRP